MKNLGFSVIELIFVIIIIGIMATMALPKFIGMSNQSHVQGSLKDFQSVLNRTVAPTVWSNVAKKQGDLGKLPSGDQNLSIYTDIPKEFSSNNSKEANLSDKNVTITKKIVDIEGDTVSCSTDGGNKYELLKPGGNQKKFEAKIGKATYGVVWCNGSSTIAPKYYIYKE